MVVKLVETIPDSGGTRATSVVVRTGSWSRPHALVAAAARLGCVTETGQERTLPEMASGMHDDLTTRAG